MIPRSILELNVAELDREFKAKELFSYAKARLPLVLRLDGVRFGRVLEGYEKPRDRRVHEALVEACKSIMLELSADVCYVVSDELNVFLVKTCPFSCRVEKLVSISASIASSVVSRKLRLSTYFDSRVVQLDSLEDAVRYLMYRARVGYNNYVSQLFHSYKKSKETPSLRAMIEELCSEGLCAELAPSWKSLGSCIAWIEVKKTGFNPLTREYVEVARRRLEVREGLELCLEALQKLSVGFCRDSSRSSDPTSTPHPR